MSEEKNFEFSIVGRRIEYQEFQKLIAIPSSHLIKVFNRNGKVYKHINNVHDVYLELRWIARAFPPGFFQIKTLRKDEIEIVRWEERKDSQEDGPAYVKCVNCSTPFVEIFKEYCQWHFHNFCSFNCGRQFYSDWSLK